MSEVNDDGGPAFPRTAGPIIDHDAYHQPQDGMTLRDYFAGQALVGLGFWWCPHEEKTKANPKYDRNRAIQENALLAYNIADAMLKARKGNA